MTKRPLPEQEWTPAPIEHAGLCERLELTIGQISALTGLTIRQLSYWTSKGILVARNPRKRIYDWPAIEKAILLKQALDAGLTLGAATSHVTLILGDRLARRRATPRAAALATYSFAPSADPAAALRLVQAQLASARRDENPADLQLAAAKVDAVTFLVQNPHTRMTAEHLARSVGRAPELIVAALDELVARRILVGVSVGPTATRGRGS